jgi:hypothetical protein
MCRLAPSQQDGIDPENGNVIYSLNFMFIFLLQNFVPKQHLREVVGSGAEAVQIAANVLLVQARLANQVNELELSLGVFWLVMSLLNYAQNLK